MSDENTTKKEEKLEWPMARVRDSFVDFFKENGHTHWPSSPCVPLDDPTLLFINAGMNQYKPLFLGTISPNSPMAKLKRATNSQKCIRAGGKHNDLEDVGKDVYHHTFFEMLGNWSFGDYFKAEAIDFAWRCLIDVYKLDPSRMYATFFEGNAQAPRDEEAHNLWAKYLPEERIIACCAKDNFWEMGNTGPCGPCTEIHYDRIGNRCAPELVNADLPEMIEIWNVVFIQYNREQDGSLKTLPDQHVDTGMGFERLTSILQGVPSNYDTDIFMPIFSAIQKVTSCPHPYTGFVGPEDANIGYRDMAYRVIADHLRTLSFSIADGALPSNEGRGYVLRRILRRAVRYGRQNLGAEVGFFSRLVPCLVELMGDVYPELVTHQGKVTQVIQEEEQSFGRTLDKGLAKFDSICASIANATKIPSEDVYKLYTTHGFPIDLTGLMAEERGLVVDEKEVEDLMEKERELSKLALQSKMAKVLGDKDLSVTAEQTSYLANVLGLDPTDDSYKYTISSEETKDASSSLTSSKILAIYESRSTGFVTTLDSSSFNSTVGIILDSTNFYSEGGGQVFDIGVLAVEGGNLQFNVSSVQSYAGYVFHFGQFTSASEDMVVEVGNAVEPKVDLERRGLIASNHTFTHVLNLGLRNVLCDTEEGDNGNTSATIEQKGSFVDETKLRFDFSYNKALAGNELKKIEQCCQTHIDKDYTVYTEPAAALNEAMSIPSLRAVFGEVYPEEVRVVSIGMSYQDLSLDFADNNGKGGMEYSIEFCGGTHLQQCATAQAFCLVNEEGIAKGVRRVTALTGDLAKDAIDCGNNLQSRVQQMKLTETSDLSEFEEGIKLVTNELNSCVISAALKIELRDQLTVLTKLLMTKKKEAEKELVKNFIDSIKNNDGFLVKENFYVMQSEVGPVSGKLSKSITTAFTKANKSSSLFLISNDASNIYVVAAGKATDAKSWIQTATDGYKVRGGGKKDAAQFSIEIPPETEASSIIESILTKARSSI